MKKIGTFNSEISKVIAQMGHLDQLTICDAGLPIPESVQRIDLALSPGIPSFLQVARAVSYELKVEQIIIAQELHDTNPAFENEIMGIFPDIEVVYTSHAEFKATTTKSKAIIRSGECTPYANMILVAGVVF